MRLSKIIGIGLIVVFVAVFTIFYIVDNLSKVKEKCEKDKTLKVCQTNTLTLIAAVLLIMVAGLIIVVLTVAYIMVSASAGG